MSNRGRSSRSSGPRSPGTPSSTPTSTTSTPAWRSGATATRRCATPGASTRGMTTATGSARSTSTPWRGSGRCCAPGCDRTAASRRRSCRSTSLSSSSCTTPGAGAGPSSASSSPPWWRDAPHHPGSREERPCFFPVHEVPHLVDLHDVVSRRGRGRRRLLAGRLDPLVDRDVAHPEQLGDHPLADVAQGVEQHRQRLHRRRLAAGRRGREAAAARLAAVALMAARHAVPDERSTAAMLAAKLGHGYLLARGHERGGKRHLLEPVLLRQL